MKFGNRFKKQEPLIPQDIYLEGSTSINTERARGGPSPVSWDHHQHHHEDSSPTKKGLHVLKKLNCGAAMNRDRHEDNHNFYPGFNPQHTYRAKPTYITPLEEQKSSSNHREYSQHQSTSRRQSKNRKETSVVRPVLITVSDGDLGVQDSPDKSKPAAEFKSTFLVGAGEMTMDPTNRPRTITPEKEERKSKSCIMTPRRLQGTDPFDGGEDASRNCMVPGRKSSPQKEERLSVEERREKEEQQRIARRNRWKRGMMARSWKDDSDLGSYTYGEDSTNASSYLTYGSDSDSYTDGSMESSQWTGFTGRSTKDHRGERRSKSLSRRRDESLFGGVAEDLGLVAQMLFSDGTSCITGAMDITRETIVSCKQHS